MKKLNVVLFCLVGTLIFFITNSYAMHQDTELLLKLLENKGVITSDEASDLKKAVEAGIETETAVPPQRIEQESHDMDSAEIREALNWLRKVKISGLIEVEAFTSDRTYFGNTSLSKRDSSDITLATVELGLDAMINQWVSGHILLLWEEDDTEEVVVDEGTITIGNIEKFPLYLTAGKMYVPFGNFESNMIQDPFTLELGETRESAVLLGFEQNGFYASAYAFKGDVKQTHERERVETFGGNIGYSFENDNISFDAGVDFINNLESDNISDAIEDLGIIDDNVPGFAGHIIFNCGPLMLIGEYLGTTEDYKAGELYFEKVKPETWNIEAAATAEITGKEVTFAIGYQGTEDLMGYLPEDRFMVSMCTEIFKNTSAALEFYHDEDYDKKDGGTGRDANVVSAQLAVEF